MDMRIYFEAKNYSQRIFIKELTKKKEQKVVEEEKNTIELTESEQFEIMEGVEEPQQIDYTVKTDIEEEKTKNLKEVTKPKKVTKKSEKIVKNATIKPKEHRIYDSFFWFNCEVNF